MNFFEHQDRARKKTGRLIVLFVLAVIMIVIAVNVAALIAMAAISRGGDFDPVMVCLAATAGTLILIIGGSLYKTAMLAAVGVTIGALASLWLGRLMTTLLYETSATDALTFVVTALVLATVAIVAGYVPAARAARLSPMVALRDE